MSLNPIPVTDQEASPGVRAYLAGVRFRLILLVLLVFAPAFGLLTYVADRERDNGKDEVREKALNFARLAAAEQAQIVEGTRTMLQHLAATPEAQGTVPPKACNDLVAREIRLRPYYDNLGVLGPDGVRFCSVLQPEQRIDLSDRPYFRRALEARDFSVGDYQIGRSSRRASIGFGYPVLDARGAVRGVAYATLNLDWLSRSLVRKRLPADAVLSVVDDKGIILARFPDKGELTGRFISPALLREMVLRRGEGTIEGTGIAGNLLVWGYVPLLAGASGSLIVRVSIPVASAYAQVEKTYYRNLVLIAATALGVMLIAWAGGERLIMRPVKALDETARRLARGEYDARTGETYAAGELGALARALDSMAGALQEREAKIEQAMQELRALSVTDALTGLHNRRYLLEILPRELALARRNGSSVAVMMLDIDHFKRINDTYGHEAGDRVLIEVARLIKSAVRGSDYTCRYGGEEFVFVLPDASPDDAWLRAESIRAATARFEMDCSVGNPLTVTISIGIAVFPDHGDDADSLLRAADAAMYAAKHAGRNRVMVYSARVADTAAT